MSRDTDANTIGKPIFSIVNTMPITYDEFEKVELRSGTVTKVEEFPRAKKPSYKVWVDFGGEIGVKQTSAQVTVHYKPDALVGRAVVGCINLEPRNIAGFMSEFLLVGFPDENGAVCLIAPDPKVPNGQKLF
jgi:tRNA-binding protein